MFLGLGLFGRLLHRVQSILSLQFLVLFLDESLLPRGLLFLLLQAGQGSEGLQLPIRLYYLRNVLELLVFQLFVLEVLS